MTTVIVEWAERMVEQGPRDLITARGEDAERYLQSQLAQDVSGMKPGERRWSLLLEPDGKVVALLHLVRLDDGFVIDIDPGAGEAVLSRLRRFLLRVDASFDLQQSDDAPDDQDESDRVRHGWPRHGSEVIPGTTLPAELGVVDFAVSFTKGCYPGQELVERMDSRGASAPFRLVVLEGDLAVGSAIALDGVEVGTVTSSAGGWSIARVKRGADLGRPAPSVPQ